MKKNTLIILLFLILFLVGCKRKIIFQVNEYDGGIYLNDDSGDFENSKKIYDVLGDTGCYLFKEYTEFDCFLNEHNLLINKKIESKYTKDFFSDKSLIIYFGIDSSSGYKYTFNMYNEDNILSLEINKSRDKGKDYQTVEVDRMFFFDINTEEIVNTTEFVFSTNISK